jgi:hypothetical protein
MGKVGCILSRDRRVNSSSFELGSEIPESFLMKELVTVRLMRRWSSITRKT